jgi:hypothetical protein
MLEIRSKREEKSPRFFKRPSINVRLCLIRRLLLPQFVEEVRSVGSSSKRFTRLGIMSSIALITAEAAGGSGFVIQMEMIGNKPTSSVERELALD